jgi:ubiquinone/menaquinone biosynthesis C-methylase UbiE
MYDRGVGILTLGRARSVQKYIAERFIDSGVRILEIGCGTGRLAVLCVKGGAQVTAIDVSPDMIAMAKERLERDGYIDSVELRRMSAINMDKEFLPRSFDLAVAIFAVSEMSEKEGDFVLKQCRRVLKPRGRLIIAERIAPKSVWSRSILKIVGLPPRLAAAVVSGAALHTVVGLEERLDMAGFLVVEVKDFLLGSIRIYVAQRIGR